MVQLDETGRSHVIAPGVEVEETGIAIVAEALFVASSWFDENRTPRGFNVLNSSSRTRGNSWLGTWNSEALAKIPSKRLFGNRIESKSWCRDLAF